MPCRTLQVLAFVAVCSVFTAAQGLNRSWIYSTYFGGSNSDSTSVETRDASGNIYLAGITSSTNFPTTAGVYEPSFPGPSGGNAMYVSKFSSGGALLWSTYLGPGCFQFIAPNGIAVDSSGNVYVSGTFECSGFPTTVNLGTSGYVFVTKLNSAGSQLLYSVTLGNNSVLGTSQLALDSNANAYVTGSGDYCCTSSTGIIGPLGGISDFWVAEINSAGTSIPWSVEIGGTDDDVAYGIAVDNANKLYVTGYSASSNFPTTTGALNQSGTGRAFITKLDPTKPPNSSIVYSALAGNPANNKNDYISGNGITTDLSGDAYVTAWTYNSGLYTSANAFQKTVATTPNAYVFELNPAGSAIINGTYIGGGGNDFAKAISVDSTGNVYFTGDTYSWDFPTTAYGNLGHYSSQLGFYVKLNPQFAAISSVEVGPLGSGTNGSVPDLSGGLWFNGYTTTGFPTTSGAYQRTYGGGSDDGYLVHTNFEGLCAPATVEICTLAQWGSNSELIHFAAQAANVEGAKSITLSLDGQQVYKLNASQFETLLPVAPGTHTATVAFHAVNARTETVQQQFTVQSSGTCPLNLTAPSLTICSPLNAAVVKGTVNFTIQANDSTAAKTVNLYVDGKLIAKLSNQSGTYTYSTTLAVGAHSVSAHATDPNRNVLRADGVFQVSN